MLDSVLGGVFPSDGCAACHNSAAPKECLACLYDKKPCAECELQEGIIEDKVDVSSCIDCR
jgi:hypothetical protein